MVGGHGWSPVDWAEHWLSDMPGLGLMDGLGLLFILGME